MSDVVDETCQLIITKEGVGKPFDLEPYIYKTMVNILAQSAFGRRYANDDPELVEFRWRTEQMVADASVLFVVDFMPFLEIFFRTRLANIREVCRQHGSVFRDKYQEHTRDYQEGIIRDFADALISAKEESIREGKESAPYLTDANMGATLADLFNGGSDTSQFVLRWVCLLMANYPEMQQRMREEVADEIGDRIPLQEDKNKCHYVAAFIAETLRFR